MYAPNDDELSSTSQDQKSNSNEKETNSTTLTISQKALIEANRQKALLIRQEKLNKRKPEAAKIKENTEKQKVIRVNDSKLVDTGAGFFVEDTSDTLTDQDISAAMLIASDPPPLLDDEDPMCDDCGQPFNNSYLKHNFDELVCDECRDQEEKHSLITKTDARKHYLLKDGDFDRREPVLKYIVRKNPHNPRWGDMKLYLKLQVERRALEVWETEEKLEEAIDKLEEKRQTTKKKKFMNKMKELRMNVRSSLYTRSVKPHEHEYGPEQYHEEDDEYSKTCATCGHSYRYDKL